MKLAVSAFGWCASNSLGKCSDVGRVRLAVEEWPCEVHVRCTCLEYVCDVAMCVDNVLLVVWGEVGCASWAVRFKVGVGEDSVWMEGDSIWACFVMGSGRKEKRVARRW